MNAKAMVLASMAALALAACDRPGAFPARQAQASGDAPDPGYHAAPMVDGVIRAADGGVSLSGRALPSSPVQMMVPPAGVPIATRADGSGVWTASLGPVSEPALYRLTEEAGGQTVEAEGLIAVLPGAPTVAILRAGFGAEVLSAAKAPLKILAVDYDVSGAAVVSGTARAASPVRVMVDGQPASEGAAGPDGRFTLTLPKPLPPGRHQLQAATPQGTAGAEVVLSPPTPPKGAPYQAQSQPFGWRVDWTTPGGGAQTTLLLVG
jgi:hypothetical protein